MNIEKIYQNKFFNLSFWEKYNFLNYKGPYVHIISVTKRCNNRCKYCASACDIRLEKNLSLITAKKIIDFIFSIPQSYYHIEFQGGEPLLNFNIVKFIVEYANNKSKKLKKKIHFSIITNLLELDEDKLAFLIKNNITICSSLDPPFFIHKFNRQNNIKEYNVIRNWILKINEYASKNIIEPPNLITTITKQSLPYYREIIDEYVKLKIPRIPLGILEPIGRAKLFWNEISYSAQEYIDFYKGAFSYIYYLNTHKGINVYEKGLFYLISEIFSLERNSSRSLDILLRFAYDINGNIYPSDELRYLGESKTLYYSIGNVYENNFKTLLLSERTINILKFALSPQNYACYLCKYNLLCNIPLYIRLLGYNIFSERCRIFREIFKLIDISLNNKEMLKMFFKWIKLYG